MELYSGKKLLIAIDELLEGKLMLHIVNHSEYHEPSNMYGYVRLRDGITCPTVELPTSSDSVSISGSYCLHHSLSLWIIPKKRYTS